jgi:hypothetical protein
LNAGMPIRLSRSCMKPCFSRSNPVSGKYGCRVWPAGVEVLGLEAAAAAGGGELGGGEACDELE